MNYELYKLITLPMILINEYTNKWKYIVLAFSYKFDGNSFMEVQLLANRKYDL